MLYNWLHHGDIKFLLLFQLSSANSHHIIRSNNKTHCIHFPGQKNISKWKIPVNNAMRVKIQNSFDHLSHYVTSFEQIKSNISLILSIIKFLSCYSHNFCYKAISTTSFFYNPCSFCSLIDFKRLLNKFCWKFSLLTIFSIIVLLTFP